jgi:hypothetical protein
MLLAGLTRHAIPGLDFYTYAGEEVQGNKFGFSSPGPAHTAFGWGNPASTVETIIAKWLARRTRKKKTPVRIR